jgi:cellobiose phosphorylase
MVHPVSDIVVPKIVQSTWLPGAQVVITSQSTKWNEQFTRTIGGVEKYDSTNVKLILSSPIPNPMTKQEGDFQVEVALLSRNIVLEGAHLTVFRTPSVIQTVHGVQFQHLQIPADGNEPRHVRWNHIPCGKS